jgi:hypothetical protein
VISWIVWSQPLPRSSTDLMTRELSDMKQSEQFWMRGTKTEMFQNLRASISSCFGKSLLVLLASMMLGAAFTSCIPGQGCTNAGVPGAECTFTGPDMLNARFEVVGQSPLHQSATIWMSSGEKLAGLWDTFTYYVTVGPEICDFTNFTTYTEGCSICNLCNDPLYLQRCRFDGFGPGRGGDIEHVFPRVRAFAGGSTEAEELFAADFWSGCSAGGFSPVLFAPNDNFTYQLMAPDVSSPTTPPSPAEVARKKVFVIQDGLTQPANYELGHYVTDSSSTPTAWFSWTMRGNPIWEDNFTESVRVANVRILTGRPSSDPVTGRFRLADQKIVRPSRIVFLRSFVPSNPVSPSDILNHADERIQRCYADPGKEDGSITLTNCRTAVGNNNGLLFDATPTYVKAQPADQLTWVAEFKASEGADFDPTTAGFDPVPANALLAIEFTIEKVP